MTQEQVSASSPPTLEQVVGEVAHITAGFPPLDGLPVGSIRQGLGDFLDAQRRCFAGEPKELWLEASRTATLKLRTFDGDALPIETRSQLADYVEGLGNTKVVVDLVAWLRTEITFQALRASLAASATDRQLMSLAFSDVIRDETISDEMQPRGPDQVNRSAA